MPPMAQLVEQAARDTDVDLVVDDVDEVLRLS
jgi:hypothetical protein